MNGGFIKNIFYKILTFIILFSCLLKAQLVQTNGPGGGNVSALAVSPNGTGGTNLFAGTPGAGVWVRPISEMITAVENNHNDIPDHFELKQNYPNPFNPSSKIDFTIPKSSFVNLKVYNILGEEIATLVNETKAPGNYEVNFSAKGRSAYGGNAANLPSGIYFYKLQAGSLTESKKMIFLK